eukprot:gene4321-4742_t
MDGRDVYEWKVIHDGRGRTPNIRANAAAWTFDNALWMACGEGSGLGKSSEVWKFDLTTMLWSRVEVLAGDGQAQAQAQPPSRDGHSIAWIGDGRFVLFGGQGFAEKNSKLGKEVDNLRTQTHCKRDVLNDLWVFDCRRLAWQAIYPDGLLFPMGRRGHCCLYLSSQHDAAAAAAAAAAVTDQMETLSHHTHHSRHSRRSQRNTAMAAPLPLPVTSSPASPLGDSVLLVFGGAGIELSKFTEQLYNDLWAYSFETNQWTRPDTHGESPPGLSDHRAVRQGEHMIVVGGLCSHSSSSSTAYLNPLAVLTLHLPSLTWSTVQLNQSISSVNLGIYAFSLIADAAATSPPAPPAATTSLVIFGGNVIVDPHTASISKTLSRPLESDDDNLLRLVTLRDRSVATVRASGTAPAARYAHMTFPGRQALQQVQEEEEGRTASEQPLMYVYGGCSIATGGYCDPLIYALYHYRTATPAGGPLSSSSTTTSFALHRQSQVRQSRATLRGQVNRVGMAEDSRLSEASLLSHRAGGGGGGGSTGLGLGMGIGGGSSIWENIQTRCDSSGHRPSLSTVPSPSSWQEIKLSLTASHSERIFDFLKPTDSTTMLAPLGGGGGEAFDASPSRRMMTGTAGSSSPLSPRRMRMLSLPEFGVRSTQSMSRGSPFSPFHLPGLSTPPPPATIYSSSPRLMRDSINNLTSSISGRSFFLLDSPNSKKCHPPVPSHIVSVRGPRSGGGGGRSHSRGGLSRGGDHLAGLPEEERLARMEEERRERVARIKETLKPLMKHQSHHHHGLSKVHARETFNTIFACDYPAY